MKKQMVVCFVAAAVMMLVTGCGTKERPHNTSY